MIGNWEAAYRDLQTSLRLDYSDDANEAIKEIEPKVILRNWILIYMYVSIIFTYKLPRETHENYHCL